MSRVLETAPNMMSRSAPGVLGNGSASGGSWDESMSPLRQAREQFAQAPIAEAVRSEGPRVGEGKAEEDGGEMVKKLRVKCVNPIRGLMFRCRPKKPVLLKIPNGRFIRGNGIHTWFVFYPIDVAFVSQEGNVVGISRLKPFSSRNLPKQARYVIEAPAEQLSVSVGDTVEFEEEV